MEIFIGRAGQQFGPYTCDQINEYLASGHLALTDVAWHEGAPDWAPLSTLPMITMSLPIPRLDQTSISPAMPEPGDQVISFVTRELTFWQKLLQAYWVNPGSWLLARIDLDSSRITIRRRNGASDAIGIGAFTCTFGTDNFDRREFRIATNDGRKIHFKEIPDMLTKSEWDTIAQFLGATESGWNRLLHAAHRVIRHHPHHHG